MVTCIFVTMAPLALVACSDTSSSFGKYFAGTTLVINVVTIETEPELRYATIDPEKVIRHWRLLPSGENLELILVHLKVENHTAINAVFDVDQQAAELRDFVRNTYFPVDLSNRLHQDLRDQPEVTVHMSEGHCFDPNRMYVSQGTTVNWVNDGSVSHYVKLDSPDGESPSIGPGESYSRTFSETGVTDYECYAQDQLEQPARIVVEDTGGQSAVPERSMVFIDGSFALQKNTGIDGWVVFEAPKGTEFRELRWRAGDLITVPF